MKCAICRSRKPTRYCPAVNGNICGPCCGREREVTLRCPFSCVYLQQSRQHERRPIDLKAMPHPEIPLTRDLLDRRLREVALAGRALLIASRTQEGLLDSDMREVLAALTMSFKTRQSGLYYEALPEHNMLARRLCQQFEPQLREVAQDFREEEPSFTLTDTGTYEALVYLDKMAFLENNGRPLCRAFLQNLHERFQMEEEAAEAEPSPSGLIFPG